MKDGPEPRCRGVARRSRSGERRANRPGTRFSPRQASVRSTPPTTSKSPDLCGSDGQSQRWRAGRRGRKEVFAGGHPRGRTIRRSDGSDLAVARTPCGEPFEDSGIPFSRSVVLFRRSRRHVPGWGGDHRLSPEARKGLILLRPGSPAACRTDWAGFGVWDVEGPR